jgi:ribosomal protein L11 methyltransferase
MLAPARARDAMDRSTTSWRELRIEVAEALTDAVASMLADEGATTTMIETVAPGRTEVATHLPDDRAEAVTRSLTTWLESLATIEPAARDARVSTASLPALDWDALFREHHRPLAIGGRLLVAPPWDVPELPDREVLVIEPGMAFGTGQHETTRTCLEEIELAVTGGGVRSALDVGTGSGVLAAAMVRLGVPRVVALDIDAAVIPLAHANLVRNRADRVALLAGGVDALRASFDLVAANLLADTLVEHAAALARVVAAPGRLVVSGVLDTQAEAVAAAFPGLRLAAVRAAGPWRTLRLER